MFSYLSAIPATNSSVVLAMMVASLLPLGFAILAKLFGGFKSKDNANPREFLGKQTGAAARAHAAQQNSYETLPVFLAAVILRIIYGLAYIANWATFRSIIWSLSLACPMMLFYLAIRLS